MEINEVYLLRHCETQSNSQNIFLGQQDEKILRHSIVKSELTGIRSSINIYTSPLIRCLETVNILLSQLFLAEVKPVKIHIYILDDLKERMLGEFEGKDKFYIRKNFSEGFINNVMIPDFCPPNGESFINFSRRVESAFNRILNESNFSIICSHLHVLRYITCIYKRKDYAKYWYNYKFKNGEITKLTP